jgi:hypothetical protein
MATLPSLSSILDKFKPKTPLLPAVQPPQYKSLIPAAPFKSLALPNTAPAPSIFPTPTGAPIPPASFAPPTVTPQVKTPASTPVAPVSPITPPVTPNLTQNGAGTPPVAPTNPSGDSSTPPAPVMSPDTQKAVGVAEKTYQDSLAVSAEELSTQEDLDKLIESTKSAYNGIKDKPIPLEFITGQLASVERRALGLAEPLERKLARMQSARTSAIEASKFSLDRADKKVEGERKAGETAFDQKYKTDTLSETKRKADLEYKLSEKKFDEDKRQFGLEYALKSRETAIKEKEAATKAAEASGTGGTAENQKLQALSLAKELRGDAVGKGSAVGASIAKFVPFGQSLGLLGKRTAFEAKVDTLKSNLTLENLKLLKGAMSDKDLLFLNSIGSSLNVNMTEDQFNKELDKVIGKLETATGTATIPETMILNGKTLRLQPDGTYE